MMITKMARKIANSSSKKSKLVLNGDPDGWACHKTRDRNLDSIDCHTLNSLIEYNYVSSSCH